MSYRCRSALVALVLWCCGANLWAQGPGNASSVVVQAGLGQTVTVGIFASSATDPNVSIPITTTDYVFQSCGFALGSESPPITNPSEGFFEYPTSSGLECRINLTAQIAALSSGSYKAALKVGSGTYGSLSTTFTKT